MKRLLSVCLIMFCLCMPVFPGHTIPGGWCECGAPGCICDPGEMPLNSNACEPKQSGKALDFGSETLLAVAVLLLLLRYKA